MIMSKRCFSLPPLNRKWDCRFPLHTTNPGKKKLLIQELKYGIYWRDIPPSSQKVVSQTIMKFGNICSFKIPKAKIVPVLLNFDDFFPCEKEPCHTQRGGEATSKAAAPAPPCAFPSCCKLPGWDPCWLPAAACHPPPPRLLAAGSSSCCQGSS